MIIDAFVRARLLGLPLLTLEARIVLGHEDGQRQVIRQRPVYSAAGYPSSRPEELSRAPERAVRQGVGGPGLARAEQLLEQGQDTLARSRRRQRG